MYTLSVAVAMVIVAFASAAMPCLPNQLEFQGSDSRGRNSYNALDFTAKKFGLKRPGVSKMVKDYAQGQRYDITPDGCQKSGISTNFDLPQCVPASASLVSSKHGQAWRFTNIDGATLYYSTGNPSVIYEKVSPDGKMSVNYHDVKPSISDPNVFLIPGRCS